MRDVCARAALLVTILGALGCEAGLTSADALESSSPAADPAALPEGMVGLSDEAIRRIGLEVVAVERRELPIEITVSGNVTPNDDRTVRVASYINGIVTDCCRSVGDTVTRGETLVVLHTHQTHDLLAEYRQAVAAYRASLSERDVADEAYRRESRLLELKVSSVAAMQTARNALRRAESGVEAADAEVEASIAHLEYLVTEVPEAIRNRESGPMPDFDVVVRTPITGTIVSRTITRGDVVSPTDELYRVSDLTRLWVVAQVPEEQLANLRIGMATSVTVRAYPERPFPGRVTLIGSQLDPDTRTIQVRSEVDNVDGALKTGMYATIRLRSQGSRATLVVPDSAVQRLAEDAFVFRPLGDRRFEQRMVTLGRAVDSQVEILEGLSADDRVVTHGSFLLKAELLKGEMVAE